MNIEFRVTGVQRWVRILSALARLDKWLAPALRSWADEVTQNRLSGMGNYPPRRPRQRYIRTGHLGSSWNTRMISSKRSAVVMSFRNTAEYSQKVVGRNQDAIHQGRWWIASERVVGEREGLLSRLYLAIENVVMGTK